MLVAHSNGIDKKLVWVSYVADHTVIPILLWTGLVLFYNLLCRAVTNIGQYCIKVFS